MKIISWNVNGIRAILKKNFYDFFFEEDADIFCIQESKMQEGQAIVEIPGYTQIWHSAKRKGYSGTAVFTKTEAKSIVFGIENKHLDEGRVITAEYDNFYLLTIYTPNSQSELKRIEYRQEFEDDLRAYLAKLKKVKPVIVCGDLNVAHKEIDLKNPAQNVANPGFSPQERAKFDLLLESGFIDTFRHFYPELEDAYTWWSYRTRARDRNAGWRIDYFLCSDDFVDNIASSKIYADVLGSDHCPVGIELK